MFSLGGSYVGWAGVVEVFSFAPLGLFGGLEDCGLWLHGVEGHGDFKEFEGSMLQLGGLGEHLEGGDVAGYPLKVWRLPL